MKVSQNWLGDYVDINLNPDELAEKLTMVGLEAGDVRTIGAEWDNIFVGEVIEIGQHPNADRLCLATVRVGDEQHTVVCGAPNIAEGQRVPFAKVGAKLFDGHSGKYIELKPAKIRGVESRGMVCSEKELGLSDDHTGIMVLSEDAPAGRPLASYLGDVIFDVTVTPNRPDCLSMIGIAREVAALTGTALCPPEISYEEQDPPADSAVSIEIADPDLCARYCGGIIRNVKVGPSPKWMQEKLIAAGMRPINNIVDITNFVMLEYGQPLHAFDYEGIGGRKIIVRRAREMERLVTLDGEDRRLDPDMLVIADAEYPVAVAGVMGGAESEVTERTTTILLESANFNGASIRRTSRRLGLISEASSRFDKGLSPELPMVAARRAMQLMVEIAGGTAARGIVDVYPRPLERDPILLSRRRVAQILGIDFTLDRIRQTLERLGFVCEEVGDSDMLVTVPYWRTDVNIVEDLVEEVARIIGYDEIPTTMLSGEIPQHEPRPLMTLKETVRDILIGCGMQEVINYSMTGEDVIRKTNPDSGPGEALRIANPMSRDQEFLRRSLRGGLLKAFAHNERYQRKGIMLFEIGKVYHPRQGGLPDEPEMLGGVMGGTRFGQTRFGDRGALDFFYAKGVIETLFDHLGIDALFEAGEDALLLSGKCANVLADSQVVGVVGELHPAVAGAFEIATGSVCLFDIEMEKLVPLTERMRTYRPIPRFPSTDRDIAVVVDASLPVQKVRDVIMSFPQVSEAILFDVYQGQQVPPGNKSVAFALRYQSMDRTLTDSEVDKLQHKMLARLEHELGAVLRG